MDVNALCPFQKAAKLWNFVFNLSSTFFYKQISIKLSMNDIIFIYEIKYDLKGH